MPAPAYKFRVTHSGGDFRCDVEAAYSDVKPTGHMVLENADGHTVFTAEPGLGTTFERRERTEAGNPPGACVPGPVPFSDFGAAWQEACADAWDDGRRAPAVLLPDFMWPGLTEMINPVTGDAVAVTRVRTFPVQNRAGGDPGEAPGDYWTEETLVRVTHTATGRSAEAATRDEAIGRLVTELVTAGPGTPASRNAEA